MKKINKILISIVIVATLVFTSTITAFAKANQAYSIGGEFHSGNDVITAANCWAQCGYKSYYTTEPTYSYVSSSSRLNSDILYFSSHGSQTSLSLPNGVKLTNGTNNSSKNEVGIKSYSLTNTKLVVYDACLTANGKTNLCTETRASGADAVIGWRVIIDANDAYKWQKRFQKYCNLGYKVHLAMDYADSFSDYNYNADIKSHLIYGDWLQVIKKSSASSASVLNETTVYEEFETVNRIKNIEEISCNYNSVNYDLIEKTLAENFDSFYSHSYDITVTSKSIDNKSFVVDYIIKEGDFLTESGYTLIFHDGKANTVYDNTIIAPAVCTVLTNENDININDTQIKNALSEAEATVISMNDGSTVESQTWDLYYDVETNTKYIRVKTVYNYQNTDNVGAFSSLYEIG